MAVTWTDYKPEVVELARRPWTIEVRPYEDGSFFARVVELPGCMTEADSRVEVLDALDEALAEWLATALEAGNSIPELKSEGEFSGKIFVRTSPELHRHVSEAAERSGVSMAQWVGELLAREVGGHLPKERSLEAILAGLKELTDTVMAMKPDVEAAGASARGVIPDKHHEARESMISYVRRNSFSETAWRRRAAKVPQDRVARAKPDAANSHLSIVAG